MNLAKNADHLFDRGMTLATAGNLEEAHSLFSQACEIRPTNADFQYFRGKTAYDLGRYEVALEALSLAVQHDSFDHPYIAAHYATVLMKFGRGSEIVPKLLSLLARPGRNTPEIHATLTELSLIPSVEIPRPANFAAPLEDRRFIYYGHGMYKSECRLRILRQEHTYVLLTWDALSNGTSITNGIEDVVKTLLKASPLIVNDTRIFIHYEDGVSGPNIMEITLEPGLVNPRFHDFEFDEFERLTGIRLFWKP